MPREWDQAHLENVEIADNTISVHYHVDTAGTTQLKITQNKEDWTLRLVLEGAREAELQVIEGTVITQQQQGTRLELEGRGRTLEVRYKTN